MNNYYIYSCLLKYLFVLGFLVKITSASCFNRTSCATCLSSYSCIWCNGNCKHISKPCFSAYSLTCNLPIIGLAGLCLCACCCCCLLCIILVYFRRVCCCRERKERHKETSVPIETMCLLENKKEGSVTSKQREALINKYKSMGLNTDKLTK